MLVLQLLINGVQTGALYALIAVGFSLIFGATRIFHFAHGATFTIAGYLFYYVFSLNGYHWIVAVLVAAFGSILFGVALYKWVYKPIQRHDGSFFTIFVASLGIGIVVQNVIGIVFGRGFISSTTALSESIEGPAGLYVSPLSAIAIICMLIFFLGLQRFLNSTHTGIAMRALSENPTLIKVYGVDPRKISVIVFAVGSAAVVPAAVLTVCSSGLNPAVGHHVMLISLAATIVGGVGSLKGAAFAGMLLGISENLSLIYLGPQWSEAVTFIVFFVFILFRPSGFFGRQTAH